MNIYFANREMVIQGMASTSLTGGFHIVEDTKTEDVDTGVSSLECTIRWTEESRELAGKCTEAGNYILKPSKAFEGLYGGTYSIQEFYTIIEVEEDTKDQTMYIYAEDAGMDLLNGVVGPYEATTAHSAAWYINRFAADTGFEIWVNQISDLSRKLEWTGEATIAERIASVATQFDNAEVGYCFIIKGLVVTHKYINIYKQRGEDNGVTLRLNREIDRIVTTTSVADLATALYVTGGTEEGEEDPITLEGYVDSDEDSNGDVYTDGSGLVMSKSALAIWSRYVWSDEPNQEEGGTGHIVKQWSYDTTSQSELFNRACTQLKKIYTPAVNYEIETTNLPDDVGIGDYVNIVDEASGLYLTTRVLQMQTSACDETQKLVLGDYKISSGGLSSQVKSISNQLATVTQKVNSVAASTYDLSGLITIDENGDVVFNTTHAVYFNGGIILPSHYMIQASGLISTADYGQIDIGDTNTTGIYIGTTNTGEVQITATYIFIDTPLISGLTGEIYIGPGNASNIIIGHYHQTSSVMGNSTVEIHGEEIDIGENSSRISVNLNGTIYLNGTEYTGSDRTLKTAIQPLKGSGLDNLTPVTFRWRDGDNTAHYGYIAQDVREHIPELVKENDNGLLSLAYTEIIPLLHAKINEMQSTIESLEDRITKLEELINDNT